MLFIIVCLSAFLAVTFAVAFWLTRRRVAGDWRRAGPGHVADGLARRNRAVLLVTFGVLSVVGLFEALVPDLAYGIQNLQEDVFGQSLPSWALVELGNGSISWLLYLAIWLGVATGLWAGSLQGLRGYREYDSIGVGNIAW